MSGRTQARACPERTCVGCRERAAKNDLLRIVAVGDECVPDPRGTLPGRGAYVHPAVVCLDQAVRRRAFPRALRSTGALDTAELRIAVAVQAEATP
ncbi:YlxR family protein [Streptomyces antarcticus]|uniref:YlxR family protein n=1 Tax=Streptomyces antarcticus TaxID=2996458 RepID=UPI0022702319|nr:MULTISPECIES: YlxR family protein [unclassified Streptomyces]MCY0946484.1 YlxR family protein [Streptomyces sp. H34-AA3]MCY0947957.1 YlxR family protein [Streptomyces sp. H27-S2]MCZ4082663.1 YlxR family protein [Streptomyces sp. H34-S5]